MQKNNKILILGGCGYIGSVLCPYLHNYGFNVTVVDLCWFGNTLPTDIPVIVKDIFDLKQKDLEGYDAIIFLAGLSNDPMADFSPKDNFIYNTALPAYIGFIAKEAGVKKLIYASSCSVYGFTYNRTYTEEDIAISNYPYGISKLQGEETLKVLADESFSVIIFRQGTVCGFSPRMRLDLALNTMLKNALQKNEITLSNSKIWRPILALNDLCQAYKLALQTEILNTQTFNISSFNNTIGNLADEVSVFLKENFNLNIAINNLNTADYRNYKVSTLKASEQLGFTPTQTSSDILNELKENLSTYQDFDNDKYYNINVFKQIMSLKPTI